MLSLVILAYLLVQSRQRVLVPGVLAPLVLLLGLPWPLPVVATLAASGVINGSLPRFLTPVRPTLRAVVAGAAVGLPAGVLALLLVRTQITYFTFPVTPPGWTVPLVVLLLAVLNASLEEVYWRGWMVDCGRVMNVSTGWLLCTQAVSFGFAHISGSPSGFPGVIGAVILGLVLGAIRLSPLGLLSAVLAHTIVDIFIFAETVRYAVWL